MRYMVIALCLLACPLAHADADDPCVNNCFPTFTLLSGPPLPDANTVPTIVPWSFSVDDGSDTDDVTVMFGNVVTPFNPGDPFITERVASLNAEAAWSDAEGPAVNWKEVNLGGQDWIVPVAPADPPSPNPEPETLVLIGTGAILLAAAARMSKPTSSTQ